jgi:para-nitrobenzyl esterase
MASERVVRTTGGEVRGLSSNGIAIFKGVPYAAAPVGDLRWRETMPVIRWTGVRDAFDYGAPCAQGARGWNNAIAAISREDCLFLIIWTPERTANARLPVMVFFPGGANQGGSARGDTAIELLYDGEKLASRGVIVATVNYRVGVFGFLAHPELTAESAHQASGNYALFDQTAALRWVKDNVVGIGGNPKNVTAFGQSAGSADLGALTTSPLARGLFAKVILLSNSVLDDDPVFPTLTQGEATGMQITERAGAPSSGAIAYLRRLSANDLLKALAADTNKGQPPRADLIADGYIIRETPGEAFLEGREFPIPVIIGTTVRDGDLKSMGVKGTPKAEAAAADTATPQARDGSTAPLTEDVRKAIQDFYKSDAHLVEQAITLYGAETSTDPADGDREIEFNTDIDFRCGSEIVAPLHRRRNPTWEYQFSHRYEPLGAVHLWDMQYLFGFLIKPADQPIDRELSGAVQRYWTNFAKAGDPNGHGLVAWPKADSRLSYLDFTSDGPLPRQDCGVLRVNFSSTRSFRNSKVSHTGTNSELEVELA